MAKWPYAQIENVAVNVSGDFSARTEVSLAQHHSVIERHQLVFHFYAQPCHQLYSILKEEVKQLL